MPESNCTCEAAECFGRGGARRYRRDAFHIACLIAEQVEGGGVLRQSRAGGYGSVWQRALPGAQACGTGPRGEADCGAVRAAVREEQQDCYQSPTKPSGPASTNRSRHMAIVLGLIPDSWLIVRLDWPAAAARTIATSFICYRQDEL